MLKTTKKTKPQDIMEMFPDDSQKNSHKSFTWMVPFCQKRFGLGMSSDWSIEQILYVAKNGPFYAGKRFISVVETVSFIPAHCLLLRGSFVSGLHRRSQPCQEKHSLVVLKWFID